MPALVVKANDAVSALENVVYDVFLPPKVPQQAFDEDTAHLYDAELLRMVCDALATFHTSFASAAAPAIDLAQQAMLDLRQLKGETGNIAPKILQNAFSRLSKDGTSSNLSESPFMFTAANQVSRWLPPRTRSGTERRHNREPRGRDCHL